MIKRLLIAVFMLFSVITSAEAKFDLEGGIWFADTYSIEFRDNEMISHVIDNEDKLIKQRNSYSIDGNILIIEGSLIFEGTSLADGHILFKEVSYMGYSFSIMRPDVFYKSIRGRWHKAKQYLTAAPEYRWIEFGKFSSALYPSPLVVCTNKGEILRGEYVVQGQNVVRFWLPNDTPSSWLMALNKDSKNYSKNLWLGHSNYIR